MYRFEAAADLLAEQADSAGIDINERVDDLSRAVSAINASDNADSEFARELQDKLDVALVQQRVQ